MLFRPSSPQRARTFSRVAGSASISCTVWMRSRKGESMNSADGSAPGAAGCAPATGMPATTSGDRPAKSRKPCRSSCARCSMAASAALSAPAVISTCCALASTAWLAARVIGPVSGTDSVARIWSASSDVLGFAESPRCSTPIPAPITPPVTRPAPAAWPTPSSHGLPSATLVMACSWADCGISSSTPSLKMALPTRLPRPPLTPALVAPVKSAVSASPISLPAPRPIRAVAVPAAAAGAAYSDHERPLRCACSAI